MSYLVAVPEIVASAAADLAGLGSTISSANAAAVTPTVGVVAAAGDEVSAAIASVFSRHAQGFQAVSAQAAAFHQQFVQLMSGGAAQYLSAEAANTSPMTTLTVPSLGYGNTGTSNWGFFNTGSNNIGIGNTGNFNAGFGNTGSWNFGIGNFSPINLNSNYAVSNPNSMFTAFGGFGIGNTGTDNVGVGNTGFHNYGIADFGNNNRGWPLPLYLSLLLAGGNYGSSDSGVFNFGSFDTGIANWGSNLYGIGLIGIDRFGIGLLSLPYPFPPLPLGIPYPFGLT